MLRIVEAVPVSDETVLTEYCTDFGLFFMTCFLVLFIYFMGKMILSVGSPLVERYINSYT